MLTVKAKIVAACTVVFGTLLVIFAFIIHHDSRRTAIDKLDARLGSHADKG